MHQHETTLSRRLWPPIGVALIAAISIAPRATLAAPLAQSTAPEPSTRAGMVVLTIIFAAIAVQMVMEVLWSYLEWVLINMRRWQPADLKAPQFQQFKTGTSLLVGAVLGVLVANLTNMRLFEYLEPLMPAFVTAVPQAVDVLITGLLIAATTKPVHDFFGIIAQTKNLLGNSALKQREEAANALADGVLKLAQSEAQAMVDIPGIGPARLPMTGSRSAQEDEAAAPGVNATDRYVDLLHNRTMM